MHQVKTVERFQTQVRDHEIEVANQTATRRLKVHLILDARDVPRCM